MGSTFSMKGNSGFSIFPQGHLDMQMGKTEIELLTFWLEKLQPLSHSRPHNTLDTSRESEILVCYL